MEFHAKYSQMQFNLQKSNKTLYKLKGQHGLYQYFNSQLGVHPERDWQVRGNQVWLAWKCSKLKWKHKLQAGSFTAKCLNNLTSFLLSIRVQNMEFCWFVFYNNIGTFDLHFCWKFWQVVWRVRKRKANCATIMLFRWSVLLSNVGFHQSMHKKLVSYCKKSCRNVYHYFLLCIL